MDSEKLQRFRERLTEEKQRIEAELAHSRSFDLEEPLTESVQELSGYDNHPADLGSETFEREKDLGLRNNTAEIYQRIGEALERIDNGRYGICEDCGREIDLERLEALPYTTLCIDCQRQEEDHHQTRHRPIEEEVLMPPFGRTFLDNTDDVATDGEDIWQSVARYGTSESPSDLSGVSNYGDLFADADEPQGVAEDVESVMGVGPDPGNPDQRG